MKNSRKLFVSSLIMILSCCLLFAGATFAWFSDSVTSDNNIITAGGLDVELYYSTDGGESWDEVTQSPIFTSKTWEPGHAETVLLKVVNAESLPLKYSLSIVITDEKGSTNIDGNAFKLSDYLVVGSKVLSNTEKPIENRKEALTFAENNNLGFANVLSGNLVSGANEIIQLAVVMPESVENEANKAKDASDTSISFSINLFSTQSNYQ